MNISPQEKIWVAVRMLAVELGYDTYDYLPSDRADYPFVFIGEQFKRNERIHKDHLNGRTQITVHVWHNDYRRRGTVSDMMYNIEKAVHAKYQSDVLQVSTQVITDSSTGSDLLHGILELTIRF